MIDRYRAWLGAGVLAGGMSAAVLTGAGVASADDTAPSTADTRASSGSDDEAKVNQTKADDTKADDKEADETEADEVDGNDPPDTFGEVEPVADPGPSNGDGNGQDRGSLDMAAPEPGVGSSDSPAEIDSDTNVDTADMWEEPDAAEGVPSVFLTGIETDLGSPEGAAVMRRAAVESPSIVTGLLNLFEALDNIGTAFYNLYTGTMQFLAGPARAPFGSRVRVETSSLTIGSGVVVPADWYFPPGRVEPKGLVYLQHGMLATSAFYSATAAHLAEKTHSIVVVPTLTWNIFDAAGYPLMLSHTHRAIAELFAGDRAALTESAQRAGYNKDLPTKVVLVGHSAGGGLVAGTARYMVERGSGGNLAGVLMLDGAGFGGRLSVDLAKIPESIPVYNLAADPTPGTTTGTLPVASTGRGRTHSTASSSTAVDTRMPCRAAARWFRWPHTSPPASRRPGTSRSTRRWRRAGSATCSAAPTRRGFTRRRGRSLRSPQDCCPESGPSQQALAPTVRVAFA